MKNSGPKKFTPACASLTFRLNPVFVGVLTILAVFSAMADEADLRPLSSGNAVVENSIQQATNAPVSVSTNNIVDNNSRKLEMARYLRTSGTPEAAEPILLELMGEGKPLEIQQAALLELAYVMQAKNNLPRAESILAQFLYRWPNDRRAPEVLLRQGQIFRQMSLNNLALAKFYSVMTAALALKNDQLDYYQHLVFQAQMEIAETHYQMGKFADAADFFGRLLKQNDRELNRPQTQFRLIRSLAATGRYEETANQAQDFLSRYTDTPQQPEVRFYLAQALKQLGRNSDALQQVLMLLQEEKVRAQDRPEIWAYWQQRAGNEIANQLYHEGDYPKALEVYLSLAQLDSAPAWQLPVFYQIGITYEHLLQPAKATETYNQILAREPDLGTNASPGLKAILDMARWRIGYLNWQTKAEIANLSIPALSSAEAFTNSTPEIIKQ